jgi:hypothetical protein
MKPNWRKRLEPFAEIYLGMYSLIVTMGDDELHNLVSACDKPTEGNCGWHIYRIAPLVKKEAQEEIGHRLYIKSLEGCEPPSSDLCTS